MGVLGLSPKINALSQKKLPETAFGKAYASCASGGKHDMPDDLLVDVDCGIAVLTLNRPARGNALSPELLLALEEGWGRVERDPAIRVAIVTGAGERHFCTGADVGSLQVGEGGLQNLPYATVNRFSPRMCAVSKPVICVVNGLANGGGLHFVSDSDVVVGSRNAAFMDTHAGVGQVSALESLGIARRAGIGAALLLALSGKAYRMPCERAYQLGLIDLIEDTPRAAMARAREIAGCICENSPRALSLTKQAIWAAHEMTEPAAQRFAWELLKSHWSHPDFEEGPRAFLERRRPRWNPDPNARR